LVVSDFLIETLHQDLQNCLKSITTPKSGGTMVILNGFLKKNVHRRAAESAEFLVFLLFAETPKSKTTQPFG
jgi:hypothetical protein